MAQTTWTVDGTSLRNLAYNIESADGWDAYPGKRSSNPNIAFVQGEFSDPMKWYMSRDISLKLVVFDQSTGGGTGHPGGPRGQLQENVDTLLGLFYARDSLLDLRRMQANSAGSLIERQARVEVVDAFAVESTRRGDPMRTMVVQLRMPYPLWWELPLATQTEANITTTSNGFNIVAGGNAPASDMVVTFDATAAITDPRIEVDSTAEFVQYAGTVAAGSLLILDMHNRTAVLDDQVGGVLKADGGITFGHAWWMQIEPNATTAMTSTVQSASDYDLLIDRYDEWF